MRRREFMAALGGVGITRPCAALAKQATVPVAKSMARWGVNLAGDEFGNRSFAGQFPTAAHIAYYASRGIDLVRLPFKWEHIQPTLFGTLDRTHLAKLKACLGQIAAHGMDCLVDLHNYGRYDTAAIGTTEVPISALADVWTKLAAELQGVPNIYGYDIMNEPHDLPGSWSAAAQGVIDAIRRVDRNVCIVVEGDHWADPSASAALSIKDPSNNWIASAHSYWDGHGGAYAEPSLKSAQPLAGIKHALPFFKYVAAGNRGMIGEFGAPLRPEISAAASEWAVTMDLFLKACQTYGVDAIIWAGGNWQLIGLGGPDYNQPWYTLGVEPSGRRVPPLVDSPQLTVLIANQHPPTRVPVITPATFSIRQPVKKGDVVGALSAANSPTQFGILEGNQDNAFSISASGVITCNYPSSTLNLLPRYTLSTLAFSSGGMSWPTDIVVQVAAVPK